jgi:4-amino-4-deoxy-L-arabinose transferase-like glycosyltransferase
MLSRIRASEVLLSLAIYFRFWRLVQAPDLFCDEAYYLEISSNIASQGGLVFQNSPWFVHPPFFYLVQGSLLKLLNLKGVTMNTIFLGRAITATFSIMTLLMVYIWLSRSDLFDRRTGAFVAFLTTLFLAFEPYTLKYARIGIIEHVAIFFVVGSVLFFCKAEVSSRKRYSLLSGIFWGLALLTKELSIFLIFVYVLFLLLYYLFLEKKTPKREAFKRFLICTSVAFLTYSLYVAWAFSVDGRLFLETKTYLLKRIFHMIPDTGYSNPRYPPILTDVADVMNVYIMTYLLLLLAAVSCIYVLRRERSSLSVLLVSWFIGTLSFFPLIGVVNPQFFVYIIVPAALIVGTVIGKSLMKLRWNARGIRRRGISWYLIVSLLLGMFAYNFATSYILYDAGDDNAFLQSVNWIKSNIAKDRRIMAVYEYSYFLEGYDLISFGLDVPTVVQENVMYVIVSPRSSYIFDQNLLDYLFSNGQIVKSFYGRSARYIDIYEIEPSRNG